MKQGTQSQCTGITQRGGMEREAGGGFRTEGHMHTHDWLMSMFGKTHHNNFFFKSTFY